MRALATLVAIVLAAAAQVGLADVPSVVAEEWLLVSKEPETPEGLIFDRDGNLYMVLVGNGSVLRSAPPYKTVTTIYGPSKSRFATVKIHEDGRLFLCDLGERAGYRGDDTGRIRIFKAKAFGKSWDGAFQFQKAP